MQFDWDVHSVIFVCQLNVSLPSFLCVSAVEVQPKNQQTAAYVENHVSQATWKAFVVECKADYDLLYREIREKRNVSINIILVNDGKYEQPRRMYSKERFEVLRNEHGFYGYLDETFTAPPAIMQALVSKHNVDKCLVGGEAVDNSIHRKDLIEYLSTREANDRRPGKQTSCFFYTSREGSYKYTNGVSRHTGEIGIDQAVIGPAKILKPGTDPRVKEQLADTIKNADEVIAKLQPDLDSFQAKIDALNAKGQVASQHYKEAKKTKQDYDNYTSKLNNQRQKLEEAQENAAKDNGQEKAKKVAKIKKLIENSIAASESAAALHAEVMKSTHTVTGLKMSEDGLSESVRHLR